MKFLLINPTADPWRVTSEKHPKTKTKIFRYSMLTSLYVAASVPKGIEVEIVDEDVEPINFGTDADVIGISFMTFNAPRAYEIADKFRNKKGKTLFAGGYHPSFQPDEALQHFDSVCIGEAEINVPQMFRDYTSGSLKKIYKNENTDLSKLPILNRKLINKNVYSVVDAIQATRGCANQCRFCSISTFFNSKFRTRPIDDVIEELKSLGTYILFLDDNLISDREYTIELFSKMISLKKRWFSQCSIKIAYDEKLLHLAAQSGCQGLFIGLESIEQDNLDSWNKTFCTSKDYLWAIKKIHNARIGIIAGIVFGNDGDSPDIFKKTLQFLYEANIDALQATILTPFPGTELFDEMDKNGRIITKDWSKYDFNNVVFEPLNMSRETLKHGHDLVLKEFYSLRSVSIRIIKEFTYMNPSTIFRASAPLNLSYRLRLKGVGVY